MARAQAPCPVGHERNFEFEPLLVAARMDHGGDSQLAFAEVEDEAFANRHVGQAFDEGAGARQVAHHDFVEMVLVNDVAAAEHAAALRALAFGAVGLDGPSLVHHLFVQFLTVHRRGVNEALDVGDPAFAHQCEFVLRLDTFGHAVHAERACECHDGADQVAVAVGGRTGVAQEFRVDLQRVEMRALEIAERGHAGAEIVEREAHADTAQLRHRLVDQLRIAQKHVLVELEFEPVGLQPRAGERIGDDGRETFVEQLDRGNVDRQAHALGPGRSLAAGFVQDPLADAHDEVAVFRDRDEQLRHHGPAFGAVPAQQCLKSHDLVVRSGGDGLVV